MRRAVLLAACLSLPVAAVADELRLTTSTPEYCGALAGRLATMPHAAREPARSLGAEGERLCRGGETRTGVQKLRRAIVAARVGG